ncbi:MBL fold metallo-hydrolase [Corynebacterium massiliense]|uniref:Ribonuclease Z n=1 Tax=Corynebacterium massiliense DSM 45435 TaxID=1121364 RepID=A0ABY7U8N2_9CORY|nr:MBL fold metallo-hydrolase [Corynebacterium massiliense]WCZ33053.1 Ribonuclease Z [Corynebacterium massiliense DSM 45435]
MADELKVITLGTAGGPRTWLHEGKREPRCGIATAVVVGDKWYLVDCGQSVYRQIRKAGLEFPDLGGIFITHLHSDHLIDLNNVMVLGFPDICDPNVTIPVFGPGDRGELPPVSQLATEPVAPAFPDDPTPGTAATVQRYLRAGATDINDRVMDSLRRNPENLWCGRDIQIPDGIGYHPNDNFSPEMEPFVIFEDERVTVTATLVVHPPIAPAFAFRFDTAGGKSVTISGDTGFSTNLRRLADRTDLLLHEAIDFDWVYRTVPEPSVIEHHEKSHSSAKDAATIAADAQAKQLALHHIVPGHAPDSAFDAARAVYSGAFTVAGDNQEFTL